MSDHNNINLGPALDAVRDALIKAADEDTKIAVNEERARCIRIAQEHGAQEAADEMRLGD